MWWIAGASSGLTCATLAGVVVIVVGVQVIVGFV
jgi:hypothetical protein